MKSVIETFKPVRGYEGLYQVSDFGVVRSLQRNSFKRIKYLKLDKSRGYLRASLCVGGKIKHKLVHRLVYEAFFGSIPEGMQIDHVNGVKDDNRLSNLRVVTPKENLYNPNTYGGFVKKTNEVMYKRIKTTQSSLGKPVLQLDPILCFPIKKWKCMREVERELGINHCQISSCCHGKQNTAGGFKWEFA